MLYLLYLYDYTEISFNTNRKFMVRIILNATEQFTCESWKSPTDAVSPKSELSRRLSLDGQHMLSSLLLSWECWLNELWSAPYSEALESKRDKRPLLDGLSKTVFNSRYVILSLSKIRTFFLTRHISRERPFPASQLAFCR